MKPGDHPDFYRLAPPAGASRESAIVLDREGRFWHEGALVEHGPLAEALHRWIARHPDDGRLILTNGYDWCYFRAEDVPYLVRSLCLRDDGELELSLSDGTVELLDPATLRAARDGAVYLRVKGGDFEARMTRHAQAQLAPALLEEGGEVRLRARGATFSIPPR